MWSGESRRVFILDRVKIIKVFFFRTVLRCLQASAAVWELSRSSVMWILCESDTTVSGKERVQEQFCALAHCREKLSCTDDVMTFFFLQLIFTSHKISVWCRWTPDMREGRLEQVRFLQHASPSCHSRPVVHKSQKSTQVHVLLCSVWATGQMKHLHQEEFDVGELSPVKSVFDPSDERQTRNLHRPLSTPSGDNHLHLCLCHITRVTVNCC